MTPGPNALAPDVRAELEDTLEHFNGSHADTVLFFTRHGAQVPLAVDAEAIDIDRTGIDVQVTIDGARRPVRVPFAAAVSTTAEAQGQVRGLIMAAREAAGENEPLTSVENEQRLTADLPTHLASVTEVSELSPTIRRLIVHGGLDGYRPLGGDDFAYLFVPRDGDASALVEGFTLSSYQSMPTDERPWAAYYTIRRFDPAGPSLELWAVVHGHAGGVGGWAATVEPGAPVALWGPRRSFHPPEGRGHHLFVADESGFAAVAALLDNLDPGVRATVVAETVDADHEIPFSDRPGTEVRWLHRDDTPAGESAGFIDAVRDLDLDPDDTVAFGAGESRQITAVRKYLRHELAMQAGQVFMTGYWRR